MLTAAHIAEAIRAARQWVREGGGSPSPYVAADFEHLTRTAAEERRALAAVANAVERAERLRVQGVEQKAARQRAKRRP